MKLVTFPSLGVEGERRILCVSDATHIHMRQKPIADKSIVRKEGGLGNLQNGQEKRLTGARTSGVANNSTQYETMASRGAFYSLCVSLPFFRRSGFFLL